MVQQSTEEVTIPRLGYRPWLDGLRGIAIILVFVNHLQHFIYQDRPLFGWLFLPFGMLGVDIFFVLSGFLITTLLLEEHRDTERISLKRFYIRRGLRLLPALFFFLICINVYARIFLSSDETQSTLQITRLAIFYLTNWFFAAGGSSELMGHLWSLAIEEQFYLVWPLMLTLLMKSGLSKARLFVFVVILIALICVYRIVLVSPEVIPARIYFGSDTRADSLLAGCAVALLVSGHLFPRWISVLKKTGTPSVIVAGAYFFDLLGIASSTIYKTGFTVFAAAVGLFIFHLMTASNRMARSVLRWRPLVWIGKLSYSLYLWHFFTIALTLQMPIPNYLRVAVSIPISFAIAAFSHYFIEKPFLRLKSHYASGALVTLKHPPPSGSCIINDVRGLVGAQSDVSPR